MKKEKEFQVREEKCRTNTVPEVAETLGDEQGTTVAVSGAEAQPDKNTELMPLTPASVPIVYHSMMAVDQLTPHPKNAEVYGTKGSVADLVKSIKLCGVQEPLVVTAEGQIVSGHRRLRAAKESGFNEVPVRVFHSTDETEIKIALIESNTQRVKTKKQRIAEGVLRLEIKRAQKLARKAAKSSGENMENFPTSERGAVRDVVAIELGMCGRTLEKGIKVVAVADQLREEGKEVEAAAVEEALEKSVDCGLKKAKSIGAIADTVGQKAGNSSAEPECPEEENPVRTTSDTMAFEPGEPSNVIALPFSGRIHDSDGAIEQADRLVSFLRSAAARKMDTTQRHDLGLVLVQIVKFGTELGLINALAGRAA